MDPNSVTAVTPFRLLDLPREVRDDIYEAAILDLSPPDMFADPYPEDPDSLGLRKMDTNILLTSRQVYWEARDVVVRRAQLIMVSIWCWDFDEFVDLLKTVPVIAGIDPMYRNLCIMSHRIDIFRSSGRVDENKKNWKVILHQHDTESFCHLIMGAFDYDVAAKFGARATHTLNLHCSSAYGQQELSSMYATQTLVLQKYRNILRGFDRFSIHGASLGWENGLYGAVLQDIRSVDDRIPTKLIDDLRRLEQKGSHILLQTGDVEAANVFWAKAMGVFCIAHLSFLQSTVSTSFDTDHSSKAFNTRVEQWTQLRRQDGDECAAPIREISYKLINHRLSGALRFIEQGHHLAKRHGRAPRAKDDYVYFVFYCCEDWDWVNNFTGSDSWSAPQPSEEARFCFAVAVIYRLLDATEWTTEAYRAVLRASELAPDDESIQQEKERVNTWIRHLVNNGTLDSFPSPGPWERV